MKKVLALFSILIGLYLFIGILLYLFQEKMIFYPEKLPKDFVFDFNRPFEEHYVDMYDETTIHSLLFKTEKPRGVIFYLHGNAGSLEGWGSVAETFTDLNHDVFIPDYRGYGKSEGKIKNENQMYRDIQILYEKIKEDYRENKIIVLGHSIGSGMAAKVASDNNPKLVILQAPFYSMPDLLNNTPPFNIFPSFLLKYKFPVHLFLQKTSSPIVIFHGREDEIIYYGSSLKLQQEFKPLDSLISLEGLGHNDFIDSPQYRNTIKAILEIHEK